MPLISAPAYLVGRHRLRFPAEVGDYKDVLIAAERLDGRALVGYRFTHCTFANMSFKEAELIGSQFEHCVFVGCYFRKTRIRDCSFVGTRFIACDYANVSVHSSDFRYAHFDGCVIPYTKLQHSQPSEPNLREQLSRILSLAAEATGASREARQYRLIAIAALQQHLAAGVWGDNTWYRDHYQGARRIRAALQLMAIKINGFVWGHGEKPWVLIRNLFAVGVVVWPIIFWLLRDQIQINGLQPSAADAVWLSLMTLVPIGAVHTVSTASTWVRAWLAVESLIGLVLIGLLGALILRRLIGR